MSKDMEAGDQMIDDFANGLLDQLRTAETDRETSTGCTISEVNLRMNGQDVYGEKERYSFDFSGALSNGWKQFDTEQDASYFGVWVSVKRLETLTFAEGDWILVQAPTIEAMAAELASMEEFYGSPPPSFVGIDTDTGQVTEYYDTRPSVTAER